MGARGSLTVQNGGFRPPGQEEEPVLFCDAGGAGICSTCDPGYSCPGGGDKVVCSCRAGQYAEAGLDAKKY